MRWRLVEVAGATCGNCLQQIPAGSPIAFLTVRNLPRCQGCAGEPPDWSQLGASAPAATPPPRPGTFTAVGAIGRVIDHKLAAAGERDE